MKVGKSTTSHSSTSDPQLSSAGTACILDPNTCVESEENLKEDVKADHSANRKPMDRVDTIIGSNITKNAFRQYGIVTS
jgi:hypothetical protein